jgi:hypothetical protein
VRAHQETLVVSRRDARAVVRDTSGRDTIVSLPLGAILVSANSVGDSACVYILGAQGKVARAYLSSFDTLRAQPPDFLGSRIVNYAAALKGIPYLWGGLTTGDFDCSGLVYLCYRLCGILLQRDGIPQYNGGAKVSTGKLSPGDLVYFSTYKAGASHTGIYIGRRRFISASSSRGVSEASLDDPYWKRRFYGAVTYLGGRTSR